MLSLCKGLLSGYSSMLSMADCFTGAPEQCGHPKPGYQTHNMNRYCNCLPSRKCRTLTLWYVAQGPLSSPDAEAAPRRVSVGVNPPIRLGGNSTIKGKGITVRKMPCHVFKP